jgi:hypothetical protein
MYACAEKAEGEDSQGEQQEAADVAAALVSLCYVERRHWAYSEVLLTR